MATAKTVSEFDKAFGPFLALNKLALDNTAKLVEMNLDVARRYAELSLTNAREAAELKDPAAIQAFVSKQPEAFKALAETVSTDAQATVKLGMSYLEEAGKVVAANLKKAA